MTPGVALERANPVCCAAVENFVHQRHYQSHVAKVSSHKSSINNAWSSRDEVTMQAVRARGKKRQTQNDIRQSEIERENMRLLVRMHEIDAAGKVKARPTPQATPSACGPPTSRSRCSSQPAASGGGAGALRGAGSRAGTMVHEMRRIDQENQHILRRLRGAKSTVNVRQIKREAQDKEKLMRLRCEHQQAGWKADNFITRFASEGRLVPLAPVLEGGGDSRPSSRPGSRGSAGRHACRPGGGCGGFGGPRAATPGSGGDAAEAQEPPPRRVKTPVGGRIPAASRALCEALLLEAETADEEAIGAGTDGASAADGAAEGLAEEVEVEDLDEVEPLTAEEELEELAAVKEAAARAFRAAEAVDVSSHELQYGYGDLVKRVVPARGPRAGARAL